MCKFDGVGSCSHLVHEGRKVDSRVVVGYHCGMVGAQSSQGPDRGKRHSPGVVPPVPCGIGSVHKSVDKSLLPVKITFPLNITSHFSLSDITLGFAKGPNANEGCYRQ
jgi:hypothetical protein